METCTERSFFPASIIDRLIKDELAVLLPLSKEANRPPAIPSSSAWRGGCHNNAYKEATSRCVCLLQNSYPNWVSFYNTSDAVYAVTVRLEYA